VELPKEDSLVAGKYRVERTLGAGAMGVVVAATHVTLGERVALKFLNPEMAKNAEVVARFLREAQSAARIRGEHVARVTDVGTTDDGIPYLVMEHLEGCDLGEWIEKKGPLGVELAVELVLQACEALAEAHAMGIVHRDLKPANLFVATRSDGSALVKVLDFGIAKLTKDAGPAQLTALGAVMGSPLYMSPELLSNAKGVDARSDVWQMGTILYEALAGQPAFDGRTLTEVIIAIGTQSPPSLRTLRPDVPEAIEKVVLGCLEKNPAQRLADVAAIAEALSPFATTRRAQVCVEHTLMLARGSSAALPPMRAPMRSSVSLLLAAAEGPGPGHGAASDGALAATALKTPSSAPASSRTPQLEATRLTGARAEAANGRRRAYVTLAVAASVALLGLALAMRGRSDVPAAAAPASSTR